MLTEKENHICFLFFAFLSKVVTEKQATIKKNETEYYYHDV